MTVAELIKALEAMPQDKEVCVYETDPDDYLPVGKVHLCKGEVRIESQYAVEYGLSTG